MDISVNLRFTIDYAGEKDRVVHTELDQANAALSARVVYESADTSSYSSTTTTTITVYPTFVPISLKGYSDSSDSAAEIRRSHYHHHPQASNQHLSRETYLLPSDEASAISSAMIFKNKLELISEFMEPTPAMAIDENYFVYTVDSSAF
ncbi:hypothetical protein IWW37_001717 [Coemansia sp. RSA 2050]|nr:hypothetical protein IWW37_001717 [Coemansia sp. RSA 2050]KAJ2735371.1 hypothetical protein IW152_001597 [Coemansia sp. BCRC 34962]